MNNYDDGLVGMIDRRAAVLGRGFLRRRSRVLLPLRLLQFNFSLGELPPERPQFFLQRFQLHILLDDQFFHGLQFFGGCSLPLCRHDEAALSRRGGLSGFGGARFRFRAGC